MLTDGLQKSIDVLLLNLNLVVIAMVAGLLLGGLHLVNHFKRKEQDKMPWKQYSIFLAFLLIGLPLLGGFVTSVYILNGDKLSPMLALQVGLTSPAIVQSLMINGANSLAKNTKTTTVKGQ